MRISNLLGEHPSCVLLCAADEWRDEYARDGCAGVAFAKRKDSM